MIEQTALPAGARYITGSSVGYYRLTLPVVVGGIGAGAGRWKVRLHTDRRRFHAWLNTLEGTDIDAYHQAAKHGMRYAVEVHARSSMRMQARLVQKGISLGDGMHLQVSVTEIGLPIAGRAEVVAELLGPKGPELVKLSETGPGRFTATVPGDAHGLYRYRVLARGKTRRGERFTRERWLTGSIYVPRPPYQEGEPDKPGDHQPGGTGRPTKCQKELHALYAVIKKYALVRKPLYEALRRQGHDPDAVMACLAKAAGQGAGSAPAGGGGLTLDLGDQPTWRPTVNWADLFDIVEPRPTLGTFRPSREAEVIAKLLSAID